MEEGGREIERLPVDLLAHIFTLLNSFKNFAHSVSPLDSRREEIVRLLHQERERERERGNSSSTSSRDRERERRAIFLLIFMKVWLGWEREREFFLITERKK